MKLTLHDKKELKRRYEKEVQWLRDSFDFYVADSKGDRSHPLNDPENPPMPFYDAKDDPLAFMDFLRQRQDYSETFEDYLAKEAQRYELASLN